MKFLRMFNNLNTVELKSYFSDKIDWKFINYLLYKTTEFEDENDEVFVEVSVCIGKEMRFEIYSSKSGFLDSKSKEHKDYIESFRLLPSNKQLYKLYNTEGLFYLIDFLKVSDDNWETYPELVTRAWKLISDKCENLSHSNDVENGLLYLKRK